LPIVRLALAVQQILTMFNWTEISVLYVPDLERQVCANFQSDLEVKIFSFFLTVFIFSFN
jgi:hypothetical protein